MSGEWKLYDAVSIEQRATSQNAPAPRALNGIIAFLGPVQFSDSDDWVGVRLTGTSEGKGKNDGTVKGVKYFENCKFNCGMFVKASVLKRREMTKLEQSQLRRELRIKGASRKSTADVDDDDVSVSSRRSTRSTATYGTSATNSTRSSRLNELREKRRRLQEIRTKTNPGTSTPTGDTPPSTPSTLEPRTPIVGRQIPSTPITTPRVGKTPNVATIPSDSPTKGHKVNPPSSTPSKLEKENNHLKTKIEILEDKFNSSEREKSILKKDLDSYEKKIHELQLSVNELKDSRDQIQQEAEKKIASAVAASEDNDYKMELSQLKEQIEDLQSANENLEIEHKAQVDQIQIKFQVQMTAVQESFEQELSQKETDNTALKDQLAIYQGKISHLEKALHEEEEKAALREDHDSMHYKERAKLQAELLSWSRKVQDVTKEKLQMEIAMEEMTLDKESLQVRCEEMEDIIDELKIDAESAQIEVDELRLDLEEAQERAEKAESAVSLMKAGVGSGNQAESSEESGEDGTKADAEDVAQALSIQNARLREAIIRLREQTAFEKMQMTKQLRVSEKQAEAAAGLKEDVKRLLSNEKVLKEEVNELKEMVDQGNAFEKMVEDLSDQVLQVEDNNVALQCDIKELEEAAELSAEMEETQADEIKALMKELQNRDTVVVNLEEAIKIQRRRELDFQRTVGNYRNSIDKLQQEKNSLLALHEGGEGEKKSALIASQKALAQAAQSVADAALARKREANATFNLIDAKVKSHLAERLENFLPQNVASSEISAVKGELLLSKIAMKSSLSLNSLSEIFSKTMNKAKDAFENVGVIKDLVVEDIDIESNLLQQVETISHQTKFAQAAIDTSSLCLRLLSLSQWPDLLSSDASVDFSITISHSIPQLDAAISEQLLKLKEEGVLSPHQSNLSILNQALHNIHLALEDILDENGKVLMPPEWNPPSLELFKTISSTKFACLGTASLLASIVDTEDIQDLEERCSFVSEVFKNVHSLCNDISTVSETLAYVNITDGEVIENLSKVASGLKISSKDLFSMVEMLFTKKQILSSNLNEVKAKADNTSTYVSRLLLLLRSYRKDDIEGRKSDSVLSPEISDPWETIKTIARNVKKSTGDADEINYLIRGRKLEEQLSVAIENDAKLSIANTKIRSLEKNLATRSKEISMQNGRLQELETMLSKTTITPTAVTPAPTAASEEIQELKEENRTLTEIVDVLQTQNDEYEKQLRSKDSQKSKSRRSQGSTRKSTSSLDPTNLTNIGSVGTQKASLQDIKSGLVEAALFRPALRSARSDASVWKSQSIADVLMKLPPLTVDSNPQLPDIKTQKQKLLMASAELRRRKASVSIIDISGGPVSSSPCVRWREERQKSAFAVEKLQEVSSSVRFTLSSQLVI